MSTRSEWPTDWPAKCPGKRTKPTAGPVFRLINFNDDDWKNAKELDKYIGYPECERCSLSVLVTKKDALEKLRISRGRYVGIARADLLPHHGRIKQTGRDKAHHSLWLRLVHLNACAKLFVVVDLS